LPNVKTTPLALDALISERSKQLFEVNNVLSEVELEARHEIELEKYIKKVQIEARMIGELSTSHILPAAIKYQNLLISNIRGLKDTGCGESTYANQKRIVEVIASHIEKVSELVEKMISARKVVNAIDSTRTKAIAYESQVKAPFFEAIRYHVDKLELLIDDEYWTLPKYRELLFLR
jgi:glutamine synthetase